MKSFIAIALLMTTFSAFGNNLNAVDSFLSVLPLGNYTGATDSGEFCSITVNEVNYPEKKIAVTVANSSTRVFKLIADRSDFFFKAYKSEFIQTERFYVNADRNSYVDRVIRTVSAGANRLYVVVAHESTVNREVSVESAECVINL
jgi:hypothetical protein